MAAIDLLKKVPDIGRQLFYFLRSPRKFMSANDGFRQPDFSAVEFVAWAIGVGTLVLGLYIFFLGSPFQKIVENADSVPKARTSASFAPDARDEPVSIAGWVWDGWGFGVGFPELGPVAAPQLAIFQLGAVKIALRNVVPQNVMEKGTHKLLVLLYASVFVMCLHPVARVFRGSGKFGEAMRLGFVYFASQYVLFIVLMVAGALLLMDFLHLSRRPLYFAWICVVVVPLFAIAIRCYFASFSEFYGITKKRLTIVSLGTWVTSSAICPLVFLPLLFLLLRYEGLWTILF